MREDPINAISKPSSARVCKKPNKSGNENTKRKEKASRSKSRKSKGLMESLVAEDKSASKNRLTVKFRN